MTFLQVIHMSCQSKHVIFSPADHVASPVQSPGAVHGNQLSLLEHSLRLLHSLEELLDMTLRGDTSSVRLHEYLSVSYPRTLTISGRIVLCAGHINDELNIRSPRHQRPQGPISSDRSLARNKVCALNSIANLLDSFSVFFLSFY